MAVANQQESPAAAPSGRKRGFTVYEVREGTTRWVQPIEEIPFKVHLRVLSDEDNARIFDRHRLYPNSPKNTMEKLNAVGADMVEARIIAWEHPEAIFPDLPETCPCDGVNKQRLQNVLFRRDGDDGPTNLWRMILDAEEKILEAERKN